MQRSVSFKRDRLPVSSFNISVLNNEQMGKLFFFEGELSFITPTVTLRSPKWKPENGSKTIFISTTYQMLWFHFLQFPHLKDGQSKYWNAKSRNKFNVTVPPVLRGVWLLLVLSLPLFVILSDLLYYMSDELTTFASGTLMGERDSDCTMTMWTFDFT